MSGGGYIGVPVITDPAVLRDSMIDYMTENVANFQVPEASFLMFVFSAVARAVAEARDVASAVPLAIFKFFGRSLIGLPPIAAAFASMPSTWTVADDAGYTIAAGTQVAYAATGTDALVFRTNSQIVIPPGETTATGVDLVAGQPGAAYNEVPATSSLRLLDSLSFVTTITVDTASAGGADAESASAYNDRLVEFLSLIGPHAVLAADFAILATSIPGVHRALGIDGYNTADDTTDNERMVTVVGVDVDGAALPSDTKTALQAYLQSIRELNFIVNIGDPTYTTVNVSFTAQAVSGAAPSDVRAAVIAAVTDFVSPAKFAGGTNSPPTWDTDETVIRYLDVARIIGDVLNVHHVTALTINGVAGDLTLTGYAPLPQPGTISGTVT